MRCKRNGEHCDDDVLSACLMKAGIADLEKADVFLLIGTQVFPTSFDFSSFFNLDFPLHVKIIYFIIKEAICFIFPMKHGV